MGSAARPPEGEGEPHGTPGGPADNPAGALSIRLTRRVETADKPPMKWMKWTSALTRRSLAVGALALGFLVMASVFVPDRIRAGEGVGSGRSGSTDPHKSLLALGTIEDDSYLVRIFATPDGPRYSVYDTIDGSELGVLLTEEQVAKWFPDLPLPTMDFDALGPLMLTEPD